MAAPTNPFDLLKLEQNWDSYGAGPIDHDTVVRADVIGNRLADLFSHPAQYVPVGDGSVQIEWHSDGWDVECWIQRVKKD